MFSSYNIREFDLHPIDHGRLNFDSAELGLLNEALIRALVREWPLKASSTRRGWKVYIDAQRLDDPRTQLMRKTSGEISGSISGTSIRWFEAVLVKLQRKLERIWLLLEPSLWIDWPEVEEDELETDDEGGPGDEEQDTIRSRVTEFARERSARRYNRNLTRLLDGWSDMIVGPTSAGASQATLRALGIGDGIDPAFILSRTTAFSRKLR